jgi:hypothetical protein
MMQRRTFLWTGAVALGSLPAGCRPWLKRNEAPEAAVTDYQRATLAAMAETFIPSDDGSPGAREGDALTMILDPAFPVLGYVSELVADLDDWCHVRHFKSFVEMSAGEREQALEERMGMRGKLIASWYKPVYEGVLALTKLSFFGGLQRGIGPTFVEFPGASRGYATNSAAGVYRDDKGAVMVAGPGNVSKLSVTVLGSGGALTLVGPDGRAHALKLTPRGTVLADGHVVDSAVGTPAAGTWKLSGGDVRAWWISVRTDLDEVAAKGRG